MPRHFLQGDDDTVLARIRRELVDAYDEELELEIEDRDVGDLPGDPDRI